MLEIIISILSIILVALLVMLIKTAFTWIAAKISNKKLSDVLEEVKRSVIDAVDSVSQSYTNDLKAAATDGKLTQIEKDEALKRAVAIVTGTVRKNTLEWIKKNGLETVTLIIAQIEAYIGRNK